MSNAFFGLTNLAKLNNKNAVDLGVTDLLNEAPFLKVLNACVSSNGTTHSYLKQTGAPTVGFRAANAGKDNSASAYTQVDISLKNLDASWLEDMATVNAYSKGPVAFAARESLNALKQAFFQFEKQIWYGTGAGDASGFAGLGDSTAFDGAGDALVVDATGSTASTGSSCWLIRTTPDEMDMTAVIGNGGNISIGDTVPVIKADDSTATKSYGALYTPIMAYVGLQIGSAYSAVRIGNLTAQAGKGLTDLLISKAMALFPASKQPTHIVMNRRSLGQLQQSRTTYSPTGQPAPFPQDAFGVPIVVTDSIISTEAILA